MGYIRFTAAGDGLPQFRSSLRTAGIACRYQQIAGGIFHAQAAPRMRKRLELLAAETGVTLHITAERGVQRHLRAYRLRLGFLCGAICGGMLLHTLHATVRSIEIRGNSGISDGEILTALADMGIVRGTPYSEIPFTLTERRMRLAVRDIEWITLRHIGGRLIVDLTEETPPPPMQRDRIPCNVTAAVSAQITEMQIAGGEACCKVGDAVRAGDVLISGTRTDKFGAARYYHAAGTVRGIYEADFEQEQPFAAEIPVHGKTAAETLVEVFGQRFPVTPGFTPPAPAAETVYEEETVPLRLLGHTLPLALVRAHYTAQTYTVTAFSEAEVRAILAESAARWERNLHGDDEVLSKSAEFRRTDLGIMLKIHYVFEGNIGETSEFFVKLS